jgi:hypothetical protein
MTSSGLVHTSIDGSYLCQDYELRVTERCLREDLARATDEPFQQLAGHEIVKAFINRRSESPTNTRQVAPLSSGATVYRLGYGHRHRGATWYDEDHGVVWLLAYAQHEFDDEGDAFPYFKSLDAEARLLPTAADYEALFRDRDRRFAAVIGAEAADLLGTARKRPGHEHRAVIGGGLGVGIAIEVVETLEEAYLAVKLAGLTQENLPILLAAFFPAQDFESIHDAQALPTRELEPDELGFRCLLE